MSADATPSCDLWSSATGRSCGARPARRYINGWRCKDCTPSALAGKPEPAPDPAGTLAAIRARAGIATDYRPPAGPTLVDTRAIASGKRRSSPEAYRAARDQARP